MTIAKDIYPGFNYPVKTEQGVRMAVIWDENKRPFHASIVNFRNPRHLNRVVSQLVGDNIIAFAGWGVEGMGRRVDRLSNFQEFWEKKSGRPTSSKVPLMEPPVDAVEHVDWKSVHPAFRHLQDPAAFRRIWGGGYPFHVIAPYADQGSLTEAVVTPAFDPDVAKTTPVPTVSFFWMKDPALDKLICEVKKQDPAAQIGVSSLNDRRETPPFNTSELIEYLQVKKNTGYRLIVEDPLLEKFDIASSHSQFAMPLIDQEPAWQMIRRGSLSPNGFQRATGFDVIVPDDIRVAARRAPEDEDLDFKLNQAAKAIRQWRSTLWLPTFFRGLNLAIS